MEQEKKSQKKKKKKKKYYTKIMKQNKKNSASRADKTIIPVTQEVRDNYIQCSAAPGLNLIMVHVYSSRSRALWQKAILTAAREMRAVKKKLTLITLHPILE